MNRLFNKMLLLANKITVIKTENLVYSQDKNRKYLFRYWKSTRINKLNKLKKIELSFPPHSC